MIKFKDIFKSVRRRLANQAIPILQLGDEIPHMRGWCFAGHDAEFHYCWEDNGIEDRGYDFVVAATDYIAVDGCETFTYNEAIKIAEKKGARLIDQRICQRTRLFSAKDKSVLTGSFKDGEAYWLGEKFSGPLSGIGCRTINFNSTTRVMYSAVNFNESRFSHQVKKRVRLYKRVPRLPNIGQPKVGKIPCFNRPCRHPSEIASREYYL